MNASPMFAGVEGAGPAVVKEMHRTAAENVAYNGGETRFSYHKQEKRSDGSTRHAAANAILQHPSTKYNYDDGPDSRYREQVGKHASQQPLFSTDHSPPKLTLWESTKDYVDPRIKAEHAAHTESAKGEAMDVLGHAALESTRRFGEIPEASDKLSSKSVVAVRHLINKGILKDRPTSVTNSMGDQTYKQSLSAVSNAITINRSPESYDVTPGAGSTFVKNALRKEPEPSVHKGTQFALW